MVDDFAETKSILVCAKGAARYEALADLFMRHKPSLRIMVELRLDPRIKARVDPSDVLQEAYLEASKRLEEYLGDPKVPFFIWLRGLAGQKLFDAHARHVRTVKRSVRKEIPLFGKAGLAASSECMAARLATRSPTPAAQAEAADEQRRLREVLDSLEPTDREILAMRYFEQLSTAQVAQILGLKLDTARKRYLRAVDRLRDKLVPRTDVNLE